MHSIKEIRSDIKLFQESLKKRFLKIDFDKILKLDEDNRKLIQDKEILEKEKKEISKSKDKSLFEKSKKISFEIDKLGKLQHKIKSQLDKILSSIPNTPLNDVPIGQNESFNKEVLKSGIIPQFSFKPKSHYE